MTTKVYYVQENIGKAKYVVNHHDGEKAHRDGSPFFDVSLFTNKRKRDGFIRELTRKGFQNQTGLELAQTLKQRVC